MLIYKYLFKPKCNSIYCLLHIIFKDDIKVNPEKYQGTILLLKKELKYYSRKKVICL